MKKRYFGLLLVAALSLVPLVNADEAPTDNNGKDRKVEATTNEVNAESNKESEENKDDKESKDVTPEKEETQKAKNPAYIIFPVVQKDPLFGSIASIMNEWIWNLDNNEQVVSELNAGWSLDRDAGALVANTTFYKNDWRYGAQLAYAKMDMTTVKIESLAGELFGKRKIANNLFLGGGYHYGNVTTKREESLSSEGSGTETLKTVESYPYFMAEYDTRDSLFYPTKGVDLTAQVNYMSNALGYSIEGYDDDISVSRISIDCKTYHAFGGSWKSILASWFRIRDAEDVDSAITKYFQYDNCREVGRGYTEVTKVGLKFIGLDEEYRHFFTDRWGVIAFGSYGFMADEAGDLFKSESEVAAVGLGIRYMVVPANKVSLRVDYARGKEGDGLFTFGIGEMF